MRKNRVQTFTIIRKDGKQLMTEVSKRKTGDRLLAAVTDGLQMLQSLVKRIQTFLTGIGTRNYVSLQSGRRMTNI